MPRTLNMQLPASALTDPTIANWLVKNNVITNEHLNLEFGEVKKELLNSAGIAKAVSLEAIFSGDVCFAVQVSTSVLDTDVPVDYSPNGSITETIGEEEVTRQKTVDELMICIRGTEGNSLILCAEKTNNGNGTGLHQDELKRFMTQFPNFYVFTQAQLSTWKSTNIIEA